ncbi:3-phosphoshikimate 1-carboxyvinyltransferase [Candidatus Pelagibacter sp.]|nr:3-phosphoshikimate 1-carboxyvinyltransferase [Candidatus Pelagibacter sp.]
MKKIININKVIKPFNRKINISGDKSISIRFVIMASMAKGKSIAKNLLRSEDVLNTIKCIKNLGIKIKFKKNYCEVIGNGLDGYKYKKGLILNTGNSGTTARLLSACLINSKNTIKVTGDESLKKRDMKRIIKPLQKFGATFKKNNGKLPLFIKGSNFLKPINYTELRGSAQCKSSVMLAALLTPGTTKLKCLPSRNHTELLFKYLNIPTKIKKIKNFDLIEVKGKKNYKSFNYDIPGDISSASFFIVLTLLSKNSKLKIKNININPSRTGIITILNAMGAKILFLKKKKYKGEINADILVKSQKNLKAINVSKKINSTAIDEFLLLFLVASVSKGISTFHGLEELNKKESKRLDWGFKILKMFGVKTEKIPNYGIKIYGNPKLKLNKKYEIKNFLKDHRIFMLSVIAATTLGGNWKIHNPESINTSFPNFNSLIKKLGAKF